MQTKSRRKKQRINSNDEGAPVAFAWMPVTKLNMAPLGISLLKSHLSEIDVLCDIIFLATRFAEYIGFELYEWLFMADFQYLLAEWLFVPSLFGEPIGDDREYLFNLRNCKNEGVISKEVYKILTDARKKVDPYLDECINFTNWNQYKIIGFSSTGSQSIACLSLAKRIKERWPEVLVVFGGANCRGEMGLALHRNFPFIDFVCRGESDYLFPELVLSILENRSIPRISGLVYRDENGTSVPIGKTGPAVIDLDALPFPDFSDFFNQHAETGNHKIVDSLIPLEFSRGCWYGDKQQCRFCGVDLVERPFVSKTEGRAMDELAHICNNYSSKYIHMTDNILDMKYLKGFIPDIAAEGLDFSFFYEVKANLNKDQLRQLKQVGVDRMQAGLECFSTSTLKLMNKGTTAIRNIQFLKWSNELDITLKWNYLFGIPGEDPAEFHRVSRLIPQLLHLQPPSGLLQILLFRFSRYHQHPDRYGIKNVRAAHNYRYIFPFPQDEMDKLVYLFDYDYASTQNSDSDIYLLFEAIEHWREHYNPYGLYCIEQNGNLLIRDKRPCAENEEYSLNGISKAVYQFCDSMHTRKAILRHLIDVGYEMDVAQLTRLLEDFVASKIMVNEGEWYLSLAISINERLSEINESSIIQDVVGELMFEFSNLQQTYEVQHENK